MWFQLAKYSEIYIFIQMILAKHYQLASRINQCGKFCFQGYDPFCEFR